MASYSSGAPRAGAPRAGAPRAGAPRAGAPHFMDPYPGAPHRGGEHPHFMDSHPTVHQLEPYGDAPPHHIVSIGELSGRTAPNDDQRGIMKKFKWAAFVLGLLQILGLIIAISLWQTGNEAASHVVLCMGYFSTYFLVLLGSFLETEALDLNFEVRYHQLQHKFTVLKFLIIIQLLCIYLQRAIVPDIWVFGISYIMFLIMAVDVIRAGWKFYKEDNSKKWYLLALVICVVMTIITQTIYFGLFASAYATTTHVQSKLPMGALFVPIFFGQIANIVMIAMTKLWEVKPAVSGTEV